MTDLHWCASPSSSRLWKTFAWLQRDQAKGKVWSLAVVLSAEPNPFWGEMCFLCGGEASGGLFKGEAGLSHDAADNSSHAGVSRQGCRPRSAVVDMHGRIIWLAKSNLNIYLNYVLWFEKKCVSQCYNSAIIFKPAWKPTDISRCAAKNDRIVSLTHKLDASRQRSTSKLKAEMSWTFFPLIKNVMSNVHLLFCFGCVRLCWRLVSLPCRWCGSARWPPLPPSLSSYSLQNRDVSRQRK